MATAGISPYMKAARDVTTAITAAALAELGESERIRRARAALLAVRSLVPPLARIHLLALQVVVSAWKTSPPPYADEFASSSRTRSRE